MTKLVHALMAFSLISLALAVHANDEKSTSKISDFNERSNEIYNDLFSKRQSCAETLSDYRTITKELDKEHGKENLIRYAEGGAVLISIASLYIGRRMKLAAVPTSSLLRWVQVLSTSGAALAVIGGESYITLNEEDKRSLSISIHAHEKYLKNECEKIDDLLSLYPR